MDFKDWYVVTTTAGKFIGKITALDDLARRASGGSFLPDVVTLDPAYEFISQMVPQPMGNQIAFARITSASMPDSGSSRPPVVARWVSYHKLTDLDADDQKKFAKLIESVEAVRKHAHGRVQLPASMLGG